MLSIVVPTFEEADNLPALAERLADVLRDVVTDYEIIVVDDNSPDSTVAVCEVLSRTHPVRLLQPERATRDLSLAVLDGIRMARFPLLLVMDADLSHPPEKIPAMLAEIRAHPGSLVVGSRYVPGGGFDREWSLWRFLNSHIATLLARPLASCSDPMSGFLLFDRERLGDLTRLRPLGFKIGLELMVRGGFDDVREVPIAFADRDAGASKMNLEQQFKYIRHLRRLYLYRFGGFAEFIHFGAVGASGFVIDVFFYYLFQLFGLPHQVARGLSFWPAVSSNWALNRLTTFGDRRRRPRGRQWLEFVVTSLVGFSANWGVYLLLTGRVAFFDRFRLLALVCGVITASIFNFTVSTLFVYSDKRR